MFAKEKHSTSVPAEAFWRLSLIFVGTVFVSFAVKELRSDPAFLRCFENRKATRCVIVNRLLRAAPRALLAIVSCMQPAPKSKKKRLKVVPMRAPVVQIRCVHPSAGKQTHGLSHSDFRTCCSGFAWV